VKCLHLSSGGFLKKVNEVGRMRKKERENHTANEFVVIELFEGLTESFNFIALEFAVAQNCVCHRYCARESKLKEEEEKKKKVKDKAFTCAFKGESERETQLCTKRVSGNKPPKEML